jgi:hypothetical protein
MTRPRWDSPTPEVVTVDIRYFSAWRAAWWFVKFSVAVVAIWLVISLAGATVGTLVFASWLRFH